MSSKKISSTSPQEIKSKLAASPPLEPLSDPQAIPPSISPKPPLCLSTVTNTLSTVWESIFDFLCSVDNKLSLSDLNTISAIIQKLIYSYNAIQSSEIKTSLHKIKSEEHELKSQKIRESLRSFSAQSNTTISEETINLILDQLNLI